LRAQKLFISGESEAVTKVKTLIQSLLKTSNKPGQPTAAECRVCMEVLTKDNQIILTACGHGSTCMDCIKENMKHEFPIKCTDPNCHSFILVADLLRILSGSFKDIQNTAILEFLGKNKQTFVNCLTPDCPNILHYNDKIYCDVCLKEYCTMCGVAYHTGRTCYEYNFWKNDKEGSLLFEQWKANNTRPCPFCNTAVEKVSGCNHMHCRPPGGCDGHFCYRCGAGFKTSTETYEHMGYCELQPWIIWPLFFAAVIVIIINFVFAVINNKYYYMLFFILFSENYNNSNSNNTDIIITKTVYTFI